MIVRIIRGVPCVTYGADIMEEYATIAAAKRGAAHWHAEHTGETSTPDEIEAFNVYVSDDFPARLCSEI